MDYAQKAIVEALKIIFALKNLRRAPGDAGTLKRFEEIVHETPSDNFVQRNGTVSPWPSSMFLVVSLSLLLFLKSVWIADLLFLFFNPFSTILEQPALHETYNVIPVLFFIPSSPLSFAQKNTLAYQSSCTITYQVTRSSCKIIISIQCVVSFRFMFF